MKNSRTPKIREAGLLKCRTGLAAARDGVVSIVFALALLPLVIAVGLAIDLGRAHLVKQRLMNTTDAAGLAIGAAIDADAPPSELQDILDNFFAANFPSGSLGTVTSTSYIYDGQTVSITAQVDITTTFMKIANIDSFTVGAAAEITPGVDELEVVLVLDNTKSMDSNGKIDSLKTAATSLVDILFTGEDAPDNIKVGLVPFSGAVNVGTSNTSLVTDTTDWNGCLKALSDPSDVLDDSTGPWEPLAPATGWTASLLGTGCPQALTPMTNSKTILEADINSMFATGYTHINVGAIWGWRVLSPDSPFTEGVAYDATNSKAIIILTDGENYPSKSYTAYADDPQSSSDLDYKLADVCDNIKAADILVYTITFDLSDTGTQTLFRECASDEEKYFNSPSAEVLTRAFRIIAAQLKQLHVSS